MNKNSNLDIPHKRIAEFCKSYHVRKLSLFGSVLRSEFRPESDVDVLVEFESGHVPGYIRLAGMELELSEILGGHKVDINTLQCLSRYFRDEVLTEAEVEYVEK